MDDIEILQKLNLFDKQIIRDIVSRQYDTHGGIDGKI